MTYQTTGVALPEPRSGESQAVNEFKQGLEALFNEENENKQYRRNFFQSKFEFILALLENRIVPPYEVEIQPSSRCNARCSHCFGNLTINKRLDDKLDDQGMDNIVQKILDLNIDGFGVDVVKFVGSCGDPLVNPKTLDAIEMCREKGKYTTVFTNGIGFAYSSNGVSYTERLAKANRIHISLDAGTDATLYKVKKVSGKFEDIMSGIMRLSELMQRENPLALLEVSYVIGDQNYDEISEACRRVKECGAHMILYRRDMIDASTVSDERIEMTNQQIAEAKTYEDESFKVIFQHNIQDMTKDSDSLDFKSKKCYIPLIWGVIGSDGTIQPCGHRGGDFGWDFGNLIEQDYYEILYHPKRLQRIEQLPDQDCKLCSPFMNSANHLLDYLFTSRDKIPDYKRELTIAREELCGLQV